MGEKEQQNNKKQQNNAKQTTSQQNDKQQQVVKENKTLNKKLNPKEIKQLYIKNLKLQSQLDKYKEREKEFEVKLEESADSVLELQTQVNMKTQVLQQLNDQISNLHAKIADMDELEIKLKQSQNALVEKDASIQSLKEEKEQQNNKKQQNNAKQTTS